MEEKIGEGLIRVGAMTRKQVEDVLKRQKEGDNKMFGEIAIELGYVNDSAIIDYLKFKRNCPYNQGCHFYNIENMTPSNLRLKELYCLQAPEKCAIFQQRKTAKPVPITLWPTGKLQGR